MMGDHGACIDGGKPGTGRERGCAHGGPGGDEVFMPQPPAPGTGRERLCTWGLTCHLFGDECWFQRASSSELCFDSGIIIHVGRPRETAVRAHSAACKLTVPFHCRTASRATHPGRSFQSGFASLLLASKYMSGNPWHWAGGDLWR